MMLMTIMESTFGVDIINSFMVGVLDEMNSAAMRMGGTVMSYARALGIIFSLILAGTQGYRVLLLQQQQLDILALGKPLLFALLLANWNVFAEAVAKPGHIIESSWRKDFENRIGDIDRLRWERDWLKEKLAGAILWSGSAAQELVETPPADESKDVELDSGEGDSSWVPEGLSEAWDSMKGVLSDAFDATAGWVKRNIVDRYYAFKMGINNFFYSILLELLTWIGEFLWQIGMYSIFLIKAIYMTILVAFGPVYVICALVPSWGSAFTDWISKMVKTSLMGAMAYMTMCFALHIIRFALDSEINTLNKMWDAQALNIADSFSSSLSTMTLTLVAYTVGFIAIQKVPEMVNLAFPGAHVGTAATSFVAGATGAAVGSATSPVKMAGKAVL